MTEPTLEGQLTEARKERDAAVVRAALAESRLAETRAELRKTMQLEWGMRAPRGGVTPADSERQARFWEKNWQGRTLSDWRLVNRRVSRWRLADGTEIDDEDGG